MKGGYISGVALGGEGENLYQVVGISYWTPEDGEKLYDHIKIVCDMPGGKEKLWGYVPLTAFSSEYKISVRKCKFEDVVEIDSFKELKELDPVYAI